MGDADDQDTPLETCQKYGPDRGDAWHISAVAKDLLIPESTLRTWDRRYGLGPTIQLSGGYRRYCCNDIDRLRIMMRNLADGLGPAGAALKTQAVGVENFHRVAREAA